MAQLSCPRRGCIGKTRVLRSTSPDSARMDQELRGLNVIVRRHECTSCRHRFKTIEMEEAEFALLRKPKTMEARVLGQVRPGR